MGDLAELPRAAQHAQTAARCSSLGVRAPRALLPITNRPSSVPASASAVCCCVCPSRGGRALTKCTQRSARQDAITGLSWPASIQVQQKKKVAQLIPAPCTPIDRSSPPPEPKQPHLLDNHNSHPRTISNHFCPEECRRLWSYGQTGQGNLTCSFPLMFLCFQRTKRKVTVLPWACRDP